MDGSRNARFGEHLQGLDEALAVLHGCLVDGGGAGPGPRDPAPGAARWRAVLRLLVPPPALFRSGVGRTGEGSKERAPAGKGGQGGGEGKSRKRSTGTRWAEWGGGEGSERCLANSHSTQAYSTATASAIASLSPVDSSRVGRARARVAVERWRWSAEEEG